MDKLTIKQLAPYLPYQLKCKTEHSIAILAALTTIDIYECASFVEVPLDMVGENGMVHFEDFKPILRPLSDLTKEIEVNGEVFTPLYWIDKNLNHDKSMGLVIGSNGFVEMNHWVEFEKLFEWNFDVFGLIEKGLAIDINNIDNSCL